MGITGLHEGQWWLRTETEIYVLARTSSHKWALVDIMSGVRWQDPSDLSDVFAGKKAEFTLIKLGGVNLIGEPS